MLTHTGCHRDYMLHALNPEVRSCWFDRPQPRASTALPGLPRLTSNEHGIHPAGAPVMQDSRSGVCVFVSDHACHSRRTRAAKRCMVGRVSSAGPGWMDQSRLGCVRLSGSSSTCVGVECGSTVHQFDVREVAPRPMLLEVVDSNGGSMRKVVESAGRYCRNVVCTDNRRCFALVPSP